MRSRACTIVWRPFRPRIQPGGFGSFEELEADREGTQLSVEAGYSASGAIRIGDIEDAEERGKQIGWLGHHDAVKALTDREQETVQSILQGLTNKEIAQQMEISPNTVKAFIRLVMVKMKVSTRSGIAGKIVSVQAGIPSGLHFYPESPSE